MINWSQHEHSASSQKPTPVNLVQLRGAWIRVVSGVTTNFVIPLDGYLHASVVTQSYEHGMILLLLLLVLLLLLYIVMFLFKS